MLNSIKYINQSALHNKLLFSFHYKLYKLFWPRILSCNEETLMTSNTSHKSHLQAQLMIQHTQKTRGWTPYDKPYFQIRCLKPPAITCEYEFLIFCFHACYRRCSHNLLFRKFIRVNPINNTLQMQCHFISLFEYDIGLSTSPCRTAKRQAQKYLFKFCQCRSIQVDCLKKPDAQHKVQCSTCVFIISSGSTYVLKQIVPSTKSLVKKKEKVCNIVIVDISLIHSSFPHTTSAIVQYLFLH